MGYLTPPPAPAPVIVYKDVGGLVSDYQAQTEVYRREGREVRLHECRSACTLALSLPNVCVYPDSKVKFHLAYNAVDHQTDAGVSAELFASYPAAVRERLGYLTRRYRVLSGRELIALGIRNCNGDGHTMIASASRRRAAPPPAKVDALTEIAQNVQGAVAKAFGGAPAAPAAPIRVAVADREPLPPRLSRARGLDMTPTASIRAPEPPPSLVDAPPPPRRPPSLAFAGANAPAPFLAGGQPILASGSFSPVLVAARP